MEDLRKMESKELQNRLSELRAELSKLKTASSRGTIAKDSGKIRILKRNIARVFTVMNAPTTQGGRS